MLVVCVFTSFSRPSRILKIFVDILPNKCRNNHYDRLYVNRDSSFLPVDKQPDKRLRASFKTFSHTGPFRIQVTCTQCGGSCRYVKAGTKF
ncbi:hypothetical protein L1987_30379 [Smallanthus sonchifolius]|uniref:Uncharacterized protein n=1 Tax=Smallanthus sonchifolius TaxID=185202 RepID=A0ACB9I2N8_9ASTR|nr:hypothetical protein L1987_30379 [Smallanthus sonchifolius]